MNNIYNLKKKERGNFQNNFITSIVNFQDIEKVRKKKDPVHATTVSTGA